VVKKNIETIFSILIGLSSIIAIIFGIKMIILDFYGSDWNFLAVCVFGVFVPPFIDLDVSEVLC